MKLIVSFTELDYYKQKKLIAERVNKGYEGNWNRIFTDRSGTERVTGLQTEFAVKFFLGKSAKIEEDDYTKTEPGKIDIWIENKRLSVRSTENPDNNLLIRPGEEKGVDAFIFCISKPKYTWLYGWVTKAEFFGRGYEEKDPHDLGKPIWIFNKSKLNPISELFKWLYMSDKGGE